MQRRSTRKMLPVVTPTSSANPVTEGKQTPIEEEYYGDPSPIVFKDVTLANVMVFLKYLIIFILLMPWIITVSSKVKENEYIPKLQRLIEDSFTCPVVISGSLYNCTCDNKTSNSPGL